MKILAILDGILNQFLPLVRWLINKFKTTPIEEETKIEDGISKEKEQAKETGRPKW